MTGTCVLLLLLLAPPPTTTKPSTEAAEAAFAKRDWKETARLYEPLVAADAPPAQAVFRLGIARLRLGQLREALALLDRAGALGWPPPPVSFFKACALAALDRKDDAFAELHRAAAAGYAQTQQLGNEALLAPLRTDARWADVEKAVDRNVHPCRHDAHYRDFDFWIGAWDVRPSGAPESQPPAENIVTLEHDGCVVMEHWKAPASNGQSFNIWDASRAKWYQTWVDNSGGLHEYSGNLDAQGSMVYHAELAPPPGQTGRVPTRLTFSRQGADRVRQLSEQTTDGGKTWVVSYDLIYTRRK